MQKPAVVTVVIIVLLCSIDRANAQTTWSDHARISLNVGIQQPSTTFSATAHPQIYQAASTLTTSYTVPNGDFFEGGVILRVSGGFGVDVGVSSFSKSQAAPISGTIPHPLLNALPRPISGTSGPLERSEIVGRIDAAYVVSVGRVDIAMSAGPSFFTVNQDLVANVTFTESPSFDRVTFTGASIISAAATRLGFNGGLDLGIRLAKNVGVGGELRYSHASMLFPLANTASGVSADAGGTHVGGGVRFYF